MRTPVIKDDDALLAQLTTDAGRQAAVDQPGPYWRSNARLIEAELRRAGVGGFRGADSLAGMSFADNPLIDYRLSANGSAAKRVLAWCLTRLWPLSVMFRGQVAWTASYAAEARALAQALLAGSARLRDLLTRYTVPPSTAGGCVEVATIDDVPMATHYLTLLNHVDHVARGIALDRATSMCEIGGGFGANVHLLLSNFPGLRKVLYVDMAPTLYVGTQYLRAFYGDAVRDYRETRSLAEIRFGDDQQLEILCLAPWQLPRFVGSLDLVWNANSFAEMPEATVRHYASLLAALPGSTRTAYALLTYDDGQATTLAPARLPTLFGDGVRFAADAHAPLLPGRQRTLTYLASGALDRPGPAGR